MTAMSALEIAEYFFVDDITDFGAGHGTSRATKQTADDGTGEATEQHSSRTTDSTNSGTGLSAGKSTSCTGCCATYGTDGCADPSGGVKTMDVGRFADGT